MQLQQHWNNVFTSKQVNELSWYQPTPQESIDFIQYLGLPKTASIIDIGGGDSFLVDELLKMGYTNITVLDISQAAIDKVKNRLGQKANAVTWIVSDILDFKTNIQYDCWHDRAAFHFLTSAAQVKAYLLIAQKNVKPAGKMIIGTFSDNGPQKCSGLPVKQYNEKLLSTTLQKWFQKIKCITIDHITPFKTVQNFLFCSFQKLSI
jgi:2-polyprenyl-3-methyl-5-hydroxy-6-metoxy-1,4-benzoquinol methylase